MKLPNPSATRPRGRGHAIILATVLGVLLATPVVAGWLLRATSASSKSSSLAFAIDVKSPATEGAQGPRTPDGFLFSVQHQAGAAGEPRRPRQAV